MIKWEIRVLLRHLLDQGLSKAAIARQVGVNRRTINRWLLDGQLDREVETGQVPRPVRRTRPTKLDPFKAIIQARLERYPDLTAVRLFEELRAAGYRRDQPAQGLRRAGPAEANPGAAGSLRNGAGAPGADRLSRVQLPVGQAPRPPSGLGVLSPAVAEVLSEAGHAEVDSTGQRNSAAICSAGVSTRASSEGGY